MSNVTWHLLSFLAYKIVTKLHPAHNFTSTCMFSYFRTSIHYVLYTLDSNQMIFFLLFQTLMEVKHCTCCMKRWMRRKQRLFMFHLRHWKSGKQMHTDIHVQVSVALYIVHTHTQPWSVYIKSVSYFCICRQQKSRSHP